MPASPVDRSAKCCPGPDEARGFAGLDNTCTVRSRSLAREMKRYIAPAPATIRRVGSTMSFVTACIRCSHMRDTYADARERARNRGRMTCAEQEAPGRALRGKRTGSQATGRRGSFSRGRIYARKSRKRTAGRWYLDYKRPLSAMLITFRRIWEDKRDRGGTRIESFVSFYRVNDTRMDCLRPVA